MILTQEQVEKLLEVSKPLMKFLSENFHPHIKVSVDSTTSIIYEQSAGVRTEEFLKD
jgi:hypothetical protein